MKILLVQLSFLGDTVLSTPLIGALKELYPQAELWILTTPASHELVRENPRLSGLLVFDKRGKHRGVGGLFRMARILRSESFDRAYSLHRSLRTALLLWLASIPWRRGFRESRGSFLYTERVRRRAEKHDVLRNLSLLDAEIEIDGRKDPLRLFLPSDTSNSSWLSPVIDTSRSYVVLVPGSAWRTKRWDWRHYREVAQWLIQEGYRVVIVGTSGELAVCEKVASGLEVQNLAGKTSISELMIAIEGALLVICNDSMALHVASAFRTPTVAIFCATSPEFGFGPWQNRSLIVEKQGLYCKPCRRHGSQRCPTGTESCMRDLSSEEVIFSVRELLER